MRTYALVRHTWDARRRYSSCETVATVAAGSERYQRVLTRLQTIGPRCRGYDALPSGLRIYWEGT